VCVCGRVWRTACDVAECLQLGPGCFVLPQPAQGVQPARKDLHTQQLQRVTHTPTLGICTHRERETETERQTVAWWWWPPVPYRCVAWTEGDIPAGAARGALRRWWARAAARGPARPQRARIDWPVQPRALPITSAPEHTHTHTYTHTHTCTGS
jgi:hypothetical protein